MTPDELPVWKRWMIGAAVLVFCTFAAYQAAATIIDGIDTIAEDPVKQRCCCEDQH